MISSLAMMLLVAACFLAAILNLAVDSSFRRQLTRFALVAVMVIGSVFYGYGYAYCQGMNLTSLIRALMALCRMFGGINDLAAVQAAPVFALPGALTVFWLGHFLAFYVMASTAIATLGERLLRHIRVTRLRRGSLLLIYGVNAHSVAYGRRMAREKHRSVVFVDASSEPAWDSAIKGMGAICEKSADALQADRQFLHRLNMRPGSRSMELAALHADGRRNLDYARKLLDALAQTGVNPSQTRLLASGIGEEAAALQALGGNGYGSVYAFDDDELMARFMVRHHPPCRQLSFNDKGMATSDYHAVIVGFGRMGRAVLNQLVMNGQFHGSHFQVDIFDPGAQNGFLHGHPMMQHYAIRFHGLNGMSDGFYAFLEENRNHIQTIILCTGSRERNHEIADDLAAWFPWNQPMPLILQATMEGYYFMDENRMEHENLCFPDNESLDLEEMDIMAMAINHIYALERGNATSPREEWQGLDYFSRRSSRACADFYPAMLWACGKTEDDALKGDWPPDAETLENLSQTEHLRWSAFPLVSGYAPMSDAVWESRAKAYQRGDNAGFRIGRDPENRLQACLRPWDALDELSRRETELTGRPVDYKQMDRNNVLMLPSVLRLLNKENEESVHG
ncbi:MAG: hypothetical protein IJ246_06640 [Clostridia bacterium]|nr:hypothetical protein [Clostridia bacterium]